MYVCVCLYVCVCIFLYMPVRLCDKACLDTPQGVQKGNGDGGALKQYPSRLLPGPSQEPQASCKPIHRSLQEHWVTTAGGNPSYRLHTFYGPLPGLSQEILSPFSQHETHHHKSLGAAPRSHFRMRGCCPGVGDTWSAE